MIYDALSAQLGVSDVQRLQAALPWARGPVVQRRLRALLWLARGQPFESTARRFRVAPLILQQWVRCYLRHRTPEALFYRRGQCCGSMPLLTDHDRLRLKEALQGDLAPALRRRLEALHRVASGETVASVCAQLKLDKRTLQGWMTLYRKRRRIEDLYEHLHRGRPGWRAKFTARDRQQLQAALTTDLSDQSRQRIQTVLRRAQGESLSAIKEQCQVCSLSIDHWTARYLKRHRVEDLCFVNGREPAALYERHTKIWSFLVAV